GQKEKPWIKQAVFVGIDRNQKVLSERIAKRTNWMYNSGLVEETRFLLKTGCTKDNTALQALGYKECYDYLTGVCSLQESMDRTERGTVQYAKRQRTWFRLQFPTQWVSWPEAGDFSEIVNISLQRFAKSGNNIT
ncbi:MAG: tRNA dimethylallyltransferase, partial [bacterium]|nr:tRNA dimethylallyltransferase [bacterium]